MKVPNKVWATLVVLTLLVIGVLFLPVWQSILYAAIVQSPAAWYWAIVGLVVTGLLYRYDHPNAAMIALSLTVLMALIIGPFLSSVYAQKDIYHNQNFEERATLPDTSSEHVRVLPRNVGETYAQSANQLPRYRMGRGDIAYHNGTYAWSHGAIPDSPVVTLVGNQWGAFYVDMERTDRSVERSNTTMENGMGMLFTDSYAYRFNVDRIDVDHRPGTAFAFENEGETHVAQSYVTHNWQWQWLPIPQPYTVPEYGGTQVIDSSGNVQDLSPSEVDDSEVLEGQNTYPYQLARFRMASVQLQHGLFNKLLVGRDVPQVANTGSSSNSQPFTVPTGDAESPELTYFIAATPASSGDGIYQIYTIDGQTGEIEYVEFNDTRAGPERAAGYTRSQNREPEWESDSEEGTTMIAESIPTVIDGNLYWHMRVTPSDGSRISYTTFVDSSTGNVYRADTTEEIYDFIESGGADSVNRTDTQNETQGPSGDTITVVIIEDGEAVERFDVPENGSVEIERSD